MIDIKTISLCLVIINIFLCVILFIVWRVQKIYAGFGCWVLANAALALGHTFLVLLREAVPLILAVSVGNLLFLLAAWLRFEGLVRFLGQSYRRVPQVLLGALVFLGLFYYSNDMAMRTVMVSGVIAAYLFRMTSILVPNSQDRNRALYWYLAALFFVYGMLVSSRVILAFVAPAQIAVLRATTANIIFFPAVLILDIGITFAFILLNDRRVALELEQTDERLKLTLEATNDGMWDWDLPTGRAVFSPRYYTMLGFDPYEFPENYESWRSLVHPDDVERIERELQAHIEKNTGYALEIRMRTKSGDWRWILTRGLVVGRDAESRPVRMVGTHADITERKRAEEEIHRLNVELEQRVHNRTVQLEAANQELEAFAYSVSHDLRSPLRGIDGYSRVLLEDYRDKLDEDGRFVLRQVRASTQEMGRLIDDLLEFSRLGRREIKTGKVDLQDLFRRTYAEMQKGYPDRRLEFKLKELFLVSGDPAMLQVAVRNLLDNAVKFTRPRETGVIEVGSFSSTAAEREGKQRWATCFIRDNGVGFDMQYADKLFQVFQRLHRAEEFEGTGIGLALVRRIIERHGGRVWTEAKNGEGATFYFTLPVSNAECGMANAE
jgi:PAS domain S-box-containing protein